MRKKALAINKRGKVFQVYKSKEGGYTTRRKLRCGQKFNLRQRRQIARWLRKKGWKVQFTRARYVFLEVDKDTRLPKKQVARKLNRLGRRLRKKLFINEGWRTHARQWELYRQYGPGRAAYPGTSNHEGGNAADVQVYNSGVSGWRYNLGENHRARRIMKRLGLGLPVPGESWHTEITNKWLA